MAGVIAIAGREMRGLLRERTFVVALLVQAAVAGLSAFLAVGLLGLYDPEQAQPGGEARIAYVGEGDLLPYLRQAGLRGGPQEGPNALEALRLGDIDGIVQENVGADGLHEVTILVPEGTIQSTLLVTRLQGVLIEFEADLRESDERLEHELLRIEVPRTPAVPYAFVHSGLVPLLWVIPVVLAGALSSAAVAHEMQTGTIALLRAAPITTAGLVLGKLVVPILLAPAQFALWILLLAANGIAVHGAGTLLLLSAAVSAGLCGLGTWVAARLRRDAAAQAAYAVLAAMGAAALLLLPRSLPNVLALLSAGVPDADTWLSVAVGGVASVAVGAAAAWDAARVMQRG